MELTTENSPDNKSIIVTSLNGILRHALLPERYYAEYPYSFWMGQGLIVFDGNVIEDICVGLSYEIPRWVKILQHLTECEEKLEKLLSG